MHQPTDHPSSDAQQPRPQGRSLRHFCEEALQACVEAQPHPTAHPSDQTRPADPAYPSGWLDPHGHFHPCRPLADDHERLATGIVRYTCSSPSEPADQALEQAGWRALHSNGTITPEPVSLQQVIFLMALVLDRGDELEDAYRVNLIYTVCRLAGKPVAPEAPLPERLPLPKLPTMDEALNASPYLAGWLDPAGKLSVCSLQMHGRFAAVLTHALGITAPSG